MNHTHIEIDKAFGLLRDIPDYGTDCDVCNGNINRARAFLEGFKDVEIGHPDLEALNELSPSDLWNHYGGLTRRKSTWWRIPAAALVMIALSTSIAFVLSLEPILKDNLVKNIQIERKIWGITFKLKNSSTVRVNDLIVANGVVELPSILGYQVIASKNSKLKMVERQNKASALVLVSGKFIVSYPPSEGARYTYLKDLGKEPVVVTGTKVFYQVSTEQFIALLSGSARLGNRLLGTNELYSVSLDLLTKLDISPKELTKVIGEELKPFVDVKVQEKVPKTLGSLVTIELYNGLVIKGRIKKTNDQAIILESGKKLMKNEIKKLERLKE